MMRHERGFSLIELMVAMTITLIVSGAIFGLLTAGNNAFRREPELTDRQQNIRVAMDLIARDVFNAGAGLPPFAQAFTRDEAAVGGPCAAGTGVNGCGVLGTMGPVAMAARAPGDGGDSSENTDVLELVSVDERCPTQTVCSAAPVPGAAGLFITRERVPACFELPGLVLLTNNTNFTLQRAEAVAGAPAACPTAGTAVNNGNLSLGAGLAPWNVALPAASTDELPAGNVVFLYRGRVVRYRVAPNVGDPQDAMPALWRSENGRYNTAGAAGIEPGEPGFPGAGSSWQLVARGIEDLQIEYLAGDDVWRSQPPVAVVDTWNTIVRQVRITLSARAQPVANVAGVTKAGGTGPDALRGQLMTTVAPRAAFNELQMGSQIR
jgi:prepilin-type N-terminal cleavage/methylation domain-containing protein